MPTKFEARVAEHDRQIAAIRKLILTGMKMINHNAALNKETAALNKENAARIKENAAQIKALTKAQDELLRSLGRRDKANGHGKPPDNLR